MLRLVVALSLAFATLSGCAPVVVVGGGAYGVGVGIDQAMHCLARDCTPPPPPEITAARANDLKKLKSLIAENERIARDPKVLRAAIGSGSDDVIQFLVPSYIQVDPPHPQQEEDSIGYALAGGHCNTADLLLRLGATNYGFYPLYAMVRANYHLEQGTACVDLAKKFLAQEARPSQREIDRALWLAAPDNAPIVELLLSIGANANFIGDDGNTPLHMAAAGKPQYPNRAGASLPAMTALIASGAEGFNQKNRDGDTPLHLALRLSNFSVIRLLLERGADLDAINTRGETPRDIAKRQMLDLRLP